MIPLEPGLPPEPAEKYAFESLYGIKECDVTRTDNLISGSSYIITFKQVYFQGPIPLIYID